MTFVTLCWPLKDCFCSADWASSSSRQRSTDPSYCTRERSLPGRWPDVERRQLRQPGDASAIQRVRDRIKRPDVAGADDHRICAAGGRVAELERQRETRL